MDPCLDTGAGIWLKTELYNLNFEILWRELGGENHDQEENLGIDKRKGIDNKILYVQGILFSSISIYI